MLFQFIKRKFVKRFLLLLSNKCIFCDQEVTYVKRKREFRRKYVVEKAKSKILQHAKEKNDFHLTALASTNDLIAAEDQHHTSIYTDQTTLVQLQVKKWLKNRTIKSLNLRLFVKLLNVVMISPSILKFEELLLIMKNHFLKKQFINKAIREKEPEEEY